MSESPMSESVAVPGAECWCWLAGLARLMMSPPCRAGRLDPAPPAHREERVVQVWKVLGMYLKQTCRWVIYKYLHPLHTCSGYNHTFNENYVALGNYLASSSQLSCYRCYFSKEEKHFLDSSCNYKLLLMLQTFYTMTTITFLHSPPSVHNWEKSVDPKVKQMLML